MQTDHGGLDILIEELTFILMQLTIPAVKRSAMILIILRPISLIDCYKELQQIERQTLSIVACTR